jgi:putative SOS response-associated peptidase YedK
MCGRYSLITPVEGMRRVFGFLEQPNLAPRYNIAPSQEIAAVRLGADGMRHFAWLRWGLIPSWAKEARIGYRTINARAETVAEKPAFRAAFRKRRCLVLADGFYEWQKRKEGAKQPYRITLADGGPFGFAGLWETWHDPESGERIESATIIVTEANDRVRARRRRPCCGPIRPRP